MGVFFLTKRLFAVAAAAALLAGCNNGSTTPPQFPPSRVASQSADHEFTAVSTFTAQNNDTGEFVRIFPTKDTVDTLRATGGLSDRAAAGRLLYHGGPVQTNPKMYVVFWGSSWNTSTGDPKGVAARMKAFLAIVGGSGWNNSTTQ